MRRPLAGFTLIELLIVVIIIGILLAIGIPAYLQYQAKAKDTDAKSTLMTAYKAAIAGDSEVNTGRFPLASTIVNDIKADEPQASVARGSCLAGVTAAPAKQVQVDPASTTSQITMCVKSASGSIWKLTGPLTGTPTFGDGSTVAFVSTGKEITDAARAAAVQGDGLTSDSSTGIWEGTTNLTPNGGLETNTTGWSESGSAGRTNAWAKFGSWSYLVDFTPTNNDASAFTPAVPCTAGTTYTASAWVNVLDNVAAGVTLLIGWYDGSSTLIGYSSSGSVFTGTGVQRLVKTAVAPVNTASCTMRIVMGNNVGAQRMRYYVDGAQFEARAFATPYVETNGSATSRAGAQIQAPAGVIDPTKGWVAARVRVGIPSSATANAWHYLFDWRTDSTHRLSVSLDLNQPRWEIFTQNGAGTAQTQTGTLSFNAGDYVTVIGAWGSGSVYLSYNGAAFTSNAGTLAAPTAANFTIGADSGTAEQVDGDVLWFAAGTGTLTNADAATINGFGNSDPPRSSFPGSAQATMVWDGTSSTGSLK